LTDPQRWAVRARVRQELGLPTGGRPLLVVSVGRLAPQKGMTTLVEAFERVVGPGRTDPSTVLAVAGEGPERAALEARAGRAPAAPDVRLLGHRDDVVDLLAAADVVVSAAVWEGQPVWLQEALQVGAPVVATDVGGTALVLGGAGLLVDAGAGLVERLAATLGDVLEDDPGRDGLRARALARAGALPTAADALDAALTAYRDASPRATRRGPDARGPTNVT
jgi:glycosyltransferase involved in cell wall biosynthesis